MGHSSMVAFVLQKEIFVYVTASMAVAIRNQDSYLSTKPY